MKNKYMGYELSYPYLCIRIKGGAMEALVKELTEKINKLCIEYYYLRNQMVIENGKKLLPDIKMVAEYLLRVLAEEATEEAEGLKEYILDVLNDYMEAIDHKDMVLMIDTLDVGFREVLNLFTTEEDSDE